MDVRFESFFENGCFRHALWYPTGMSEQEAKNAVVNADPNMWNHLTEVARGQVGAQTVVVYDLVFSS